MIIKEYVYISRIWLKYLYMYSFIDRSCNSDKCLITVLVPKFIQTIPMMFQLVGIGTI